jgi:hypothetical protein
MRQFRESSLFFFAVSFVVIISAVLIFFIESKLPINIDVAVHLNIASRILAGEQLYRDIIVISPPFQYFFRAVLMALISWLDVPILTASVVWDIIWTAILYTLTMYIIFKTSIFLEKKHKNKKESLFWLLLLPLAFIFFFSPALYWGQKEHYILNMMLVYLFFSYARCKAVEFGQGMRMLSMLLMMAACMFKPFYLVIVPFVELYVAKKRGQSWWRSVISFEMSLFVLFGLCYVAAIAFFVPDYFSVLSDFSLVYSYFQQASEHQFIYFLINCLFTIMCVLLGWFIIKDTQYRELCVISYIALIGCCAALFLQCKLWEYHFHPFSGVVKLIIAVTFIAMLSLMVRERRKKHVSHLVINGVLLIVAGVLFSYFWVNAVDSASSDKVEKQLIHELKKRDKNPSVYVLSALNISFGRAALDSPIAWYNQYYHLWPLKGALEEEKRREKSSPYVENVKHRVRRDIAEDIIRVHPKYLVVEHSGTTSDLLEVLKKGEKFSKVFSKYRALPDLFSASYQVYRLRDDQ